LSSLLTSQKFSRIEMYDLIQKQIDM